MHGKMRIKNDMLNVLKEHFSMLYNECGCFIMYEKYAVYYQSYVFKFLSIKTCILFFPPIKIVNIWSLSIIGSFY